MLWNALILGFIGSTHCILMCGPIVLSIPGQKTFSKFVLSRLIYNFGRIFIYFVLGAIVGYIGETLSFASFQQPLSIIMGLFICAMSFLFIAQKIEGSISKTILKITNPIKIAISSIFSKKSLIASWSSGMINGLLPCGLVYVALASAMGTFSTLDASLFMLVFGLGTFPAMLVMSIIGKVSIAKLFQKVSPVYIFLLGLLLMIRGADLHIPYLSPALEFIYPNVGDPVICD